MSDFKEYTIGTLVKLGVIEKPLDGNHGEIHPKGNDFINSGIPFIMASDIKNSSIDFKNCKFISKNQALTLKKGFAKVGDVLLTHKASIGRSAIIPETEYQYILLTPQVTYYRVKDKQKINNFYLKYYFDSKYFQSAIFSYSGAGSTRAYIGITEQLNLPVKLPSLYTQQKIAAVLSSLDSKIELNNKINAELEAMAKTLYDYWFVQFDFPDCDGKPYKTSGGKMVWNDELKREIPDGWEAKELKDFANTSSGSTPLSTKPEYYENGNIAWINSGELNNPYILKSKNFITEKGLENSSTKILAKKTLLIAMYGATAGKSSLLLIPACTNQAICAVIPQSEFLTLYLKFAFSDLYEHLINLSSGSARDNLSQDLLKELKFIVPIDFLLIDFNQFVNPIIEKISANMAENQTLSELRDWLLPMLMNGQVTVT